ncbi:class I adenylate-forming enzyme family protein [Sphingobium sp. CR28]|uniref:class I adenylate-forming enzyme family protein n=1 Tax=Sphingobium sp. CR28 TaxID=3400272 RepID=UPI003FEDB35F
MVHPLDAAIDRHRQALIAPDAPFALGSATLSGATYPAFLRAPPDLPGLFAFAAGTYGDTTFLVDGEDRLSFAQAYTRAGQVAAGLIARHGVAPGDYVALAARNGAGWVIAYMGIMMAGGVACLVNAFWTGPEMARAIRDADCRLVIADARRAQALSGDLPELPIVPLDLDGPIESALAAFDRGKGADQVLPTLGPDAHATILFTSGSTGTCKGAISTHRAKVQAAMSFASAMAAFAGVLAEEGRPPMPPASLLNLPLFHVTAEVALLLTSFVAGRKLVLMPRWDVEEAMRLIAAERVTYFIGVPLMGDEIVTHPRRDDYDLSSLTDIAAGGAPRPPEHVPRISAGLPTAAPVLGYGLTETNAVGCNIARASYAERPASTGLPTSPIVDVAIFGADGTVLPAGNVGEIGIRSIANISGYCNQPEESAALFTPSGHALTGDIGYQDEAGYLFIVDRKKDIIIRGGENIACAEVEAALYGVADVLECSVFGVPDERLGEVPVAAVRLRDGSVLDEAALGSLVAPGLAPFKRPIAIAISVAPLPRLGTEKIDKRAVREAYLAGG